MRLTAINNKSIDLTKNSLVSHIFHFENRIIYDYTFAFNVLNFRLYQMLNTIIFLQFNGIEHKHNKYIFKMVKYICINNISGPWYILILENIISSHIESYSMHAKSLPSSSDIHRWLIDDSTDYVICHGQNLKLNIKYLTCNQNIRLYVNFYSHD